MSKQGESYVQSIRKTGWPPIPAVETGSEDCRKIAPIFSIMTATERGLWPAHTITVLLAKTPKIVLKVLTKDVDIL